MNMLTKLKTLRENAGAARREASATVDQMRAERARLIGDREAVLALPGLKADALEALDKGLDRYFEDARRDINLVSLVRKQPPSFRPPSPEVMLALLVEANREKIRALFEAEIDQHFASGDGISGADRAKKIDQIDSDLDQLERAEEALIREAEAAGMPILRRADASPNALLMSDRALGLA